MRNTEERVLAVQERAKQLRKDKQRKTHRIIMASSGCLSLACVVLSAYLIPLSLQDAWMATDTAVEFSGSVFANPQLLSYIVIGILSFLLGVFVTVLCVMLRKREDDDVH